MCVSVDLRACATPCYQGLLLFHQQDVCAHMEGWGRQCEKEFLASARTTAPCACPLPPHLVDQYTIAPPIHHCPPTVRKGPFQAGSSSNFHGKILYSKCRKPVYTPSDWDPALAERSADLPDARLVLHHVYGYQGVLPGGCEDSQAACGPWHMLAEPS